MIVNPTLARYATPAEVQSGCVFASSFNDMGDIISDGWTVVNSPKVTSKGLRFTNNEYLTKSVPELAYIRPNMSIVIEFWPDFAADEAVTRGLFSGWEGIGPIMFSIHRSSSQQLQVWCAGVVLAACTLGEFSPYWRQGKRNLLTVTSGATTKMYLNGVLIKNSGSLFTTQNITAVHVGRTYNLTGNFIGTMGEIKVFYDKVLTLEEHKDYWRRSVLDDIDKISQKYFDLSMSVDDIDPGWLYTQLLDDWNCEYPDVSFWTVQSPFGAYYTKETTTPYKGTRCLRITSSGGTTGCGQGKCVVGRIYRMRFRVRSDSSRAIGVICSGYVYTGTATATWQLVDFTFTAASGNVIIAITAGAGYIEVDEVTLQQVKPATLGRSSLSNHGFLGQSITASTYPTKVSGKRAYDFNPTNSQYIHLLKSLREYPAITLSAWARFDDVASRRNIIGIGTSGDRELIGVGIQAGVGPASNIVFGHFHSVSSWQYVDSGITPKLGRWYHIVGVNDGTDLKLYIDGELVGTTASMGEAVSGVDYNAYIGRRRDASNPNYMDGMIALPKAIKKGLTPMQVRKLYIDEKREMFL